MGRPPTTRKVCCHAPTLLNARYHCMKLPDSMSAMLLTGHGGFDQLEYTHVATPQACDDEVVIKVGACGLNNTDINTRTAWYSKTVDESIDRGGESGFKTAQDHDASWGGNTIEFPIIQGADVAGHIVAVGKSVDSSRVGEHVMIDPWVLNPNDWQNSESARYFGSEINGGFAEYTKVRASNAVNINSPLSDAELATFPCAYTTATNMLQKTNPKAGETVVINGASGGVGSAALQLCLLSGCQVIAIASSSKADSVIHLGASTVIKRDEKNLEEAILDAASGPIDIALDVVGATMFMPLINSLRQGGRYSSCGCISGSMTEIDLRRLVYKDLQLTGATICPPGTMQLVVNAIESGGLKPLLAKSFPLSKLVEAQTLFMEKSHLGNIVVTP